MLQRARNSLRRSSASTSLTLPVPPSLDELAPEKAPLAVRLLRVLLVALLMAAAGALGAAAFLLFRRAELEMFELQYRDAAAQIADELSNGLVDKQQTAAATAAFLGALGSRVGTFPNVTYPGFSEFAAAQLQLAQSRALSFNPLLSAAQLAPWTAYARASLPLLGAPPAAAATVAATAAALGVYERNARNAVVASAPGRAFTTPVWQIAPWVGNAAAVFYDLHSQVDRQRALDVALATGQPAVTAIIQLVQDRAINVSRASGIFFAPVFDFAGANTSAVVGFTSVVFSWDSFLSASLPAFITGIDAVLTSPANGVTFTFRIVGGAVARVSAGDAHEAAAEGLAIATALNESQLGAGGGGFTLVVYPTAALRDSYLTSNPQDACVGVVCIIVAVAAVFRLYDVAVEYHSGELAAVASIASRIVDGVFPTTVRNRLFRHAAASSGGGGSDSVPPAPTASFALKFMRKMAATRSSTPRASSTELAAAAPIADSFDDCTVLFADLVSFTAWSAATTPERVFAVLETVFGEFDAAARRLGVFKVETIGDCYLAVTGLPEPNAAHATAMADFALQLTPLLASACAALDLPPGALSLRVGLHSGRVTAGVLRADRSRFQLFGDTVNTASRMESTGESGRIQVSAATAELLRTAGGGGGRHALCYRGQVEAKGKGLVDTYWLEAGEGGGEAAAVVAPEEQRV